MEGSCHNWLIPKRASTLGVTIGNDLTPRFLRNCYIMQTSDLRRAFTRLEILHAEATNPPARHLVIAVPIISAGMPRIRCTLQI